MIVIGSERCQAMAGAYEMISLLWFLKFDFYSVRDFFPESSLFSPNLQQSILNCVCDDVLGFILNDPVSAFFLFKICSLTVVSRNSLPFFVVGSEKHQKVHHNFLIFLETSTRLYHHTLGAFVGVVESERWQERAGGLK